MAKSCGLKKQIEELNPKMGYFGGPNMPLSQKSGFKAKLVSFGDQNREEKKRKRRRRREEEKEWRSSQDPSQKGMETTLSMDFVWIT